MASIGTVSASGKIINLHAFTGEVVEQQKSSHIEVSRGSNNQVSSSTTHFNKLFIRAADGEERSIQIVDEGFSARAGTKASMVWGIRQGKEEGPYLAVVNHDTGAVHTIRKAINDLAGPPLYNMLLIITAIFIALGFYDMITGKLFSAFMMAAIGGGGIFWIYSRQNALLEKVRASARTIRC